LTLPGVASFQLPIRFRLAALAALCLWFLLPGTGTEATPEH
jgi:hypothetical protein